MFRPKQKVIGGVEYTVLGSTHDYGKGGIVRSSYTTTKGKVIVDRNGVHHPTTTDTAVEAEGGDKS